MKPKVIIFSVLAIFLATGIVIFAIKGLNSGTAAETANIQKEPQAESSSPEKSAFYSPTSVNATVSPDISITRNGSAQSLRDSSGNTVFPLVFEGSVYLPVRSIAEITGSDIKWNEETKTIDISAAADNDRNTGPAEPAKTAEEPKTLDSLFTSNKPEQPSDQSAPSGSNRLIGEDKAKMIALGSAGLAEYSVKFEKCKLNYNDGNQKYHIEFYCNGIEYKFDIDAFNGSILKTEKEHKLND